MLLAGVYCVWVKSSSLKPKSLNKQECYVDFSVIACCFTTTTGLTGYLMFGYIVMVAII
jgi:hypothetical protein